MAEDRQHAAEELLDVRRAAALVARHPETVRRWVGSGRLAARRQGNRLLMERDDVEAAAGQGEALIGLTEWADRARAMRAGAGAGAGAGTGAGADTGANGSGRSAADLVIEDRWREGDARAGR